MPLLRSFPDIARAMPDKTRHSQGQKPFLRATLSREDTLPLRQVNIPPPRLPPAADAKRTRHPPRSHSLHPVKEHCLQPKPATIWYFHDRLRGHRGADPILVRCSRGGRPRPCRATPSHHKPSAYGGGERDRTDDLLLAKQALSQLSYTPLSGRPAALIRGGRRQRYSQNTAGAARRRIRLQAAAPSLARSLS